MPFLISLAARLVGPRFAPALVWAFLAAALVGAVWWLRADAYRDGEAANDARWKAAGERLKSQARIAAGRADQASAERVAAEADRVAQEKEKIDAAQAQGDSPLDILFGG